MSKRPRRREGRRAAILLVLPKLAVTVGVSRSSVSREVIEASEEKLIRLAEPHLEELNLLVLYLDGVMVGEHQVVVGVDREGKKHVLKIAERASENEVATKGLLEELVRRGTQDVPEIPVRDRRLEGVAGGK